jgi:hypothetical protein
VRAAVEAACALGLDAAVASAIHVGNIDGHGAWQNEQRAARGRSSCCPTTNGYAFDLDHCKDRGICVPSACGRDRNGA